MEKEKVAPRKVLESTMLHEKSALATVLVSLGYDLTPMGEYDLGPIVKKYSSGYRYSTEADTLLQHLSCIDSLIKIGPVPDPRWKSAPSVKEAATRVLENTTQKKLEPIYHALMADFDDKAKRIEQMSGSPLIFDTTKTPSENIDIARRQLVRLVAQEVAKWGAN